MPHTEPCILFNQLAFEEWHKEDVANKEAAEKDSKDDA